MYQNLADRYRSVLGQVKMHATHYERQPDSIYLIAVSKQQPAERIADIACLGHRHFAENYVQEGISKVFKVAELLSHQRHESPLTWHFIGHIQSRKCRDIAENFDWVHTIDSEKVARRLNQYRSGREPMNVLVQLNIQKETGKSGILEAQLEDIAALIQTLPNLRLKGLMIIPKQETDFTRQREVFCKLRKLLEKIKSENSDLNQLSMGMSADMEAAIAEGATMVRIGTAIFGQRPATHNSHITYA